MDWYKHTNEAIVEALEKQLLPCHRCGKMQELHVFKNDDGLIYGAVAQCPDNHSARPLLYPRLMGAALG